MIFTRSLFALIFVLLVLGCQPSNQLEKKLAELDEKKAEIVKLKESIGQLEKEIAELDPEFAEANRKATLITTLPVVNTHFESFIEVSGSVESRKNVIISAETPGLIEKIYVVEGELVRPGQTLIKLNNEILMKSFEELKTNYELAKTMYERQANLWEQKIGTEVQYLEARNRKESLENQISTLKSQIDKTYIKAPFTGTIDELDAKIGQYAQPTVPLVRLVSLDDMYIKADVSEAYIEIVKKGDPATVSFASLDEEFETNISAVGQVINRDNRTFTVEVKVPDLPYPLKPNLVAVVKIKDFEAENATVIPNNLIQRDNRGDYVYIVAKNSETPVAKKVPIKRGKTYKDQTMILEGLTGGEELINEGFRDVSEGVNVKVVEDSVI
jgi:membrane fusion protein (multidrug efflux system)